MWVALEGIDGAGKTTLAKGLAERVPGLTFYPRREFAVESDFVSAAKDHLSAVMWGIGDSRDLSPKFWLYIQAAWHTLAVEGRRFPKFAVTDGWLFKFLARLVVQGYSQEELFDVMRFVPMPDKIFLLNVTPEEAWTRKSFRATELGIHHKNSPLNRESFISYQSATYRVLHEMALRLPGWISVDIQPGSHVDETLSVLVEHVKDIQHVTEE